MPMGTKNAMDWRHDRNFFFGQRFSLLIYFNFSDIIMIATMYGMCKLTILLTKTITGRL